MRGDRATVGVWVVWALVLATGVTSPEAFGATANLRQVVPSAGPMYFSVRTRPLQRGTVDALRGKLRDGVFAEAAHEFFGASYDASLADVVFFFSKDKARMGAAALQGNLEVRKFRGARHVWAIVFTDDSLLAVNAVRTWNDWVGKTAPCDAEPCVTPKLPIQNELKALERKPTVRLEQLSRRRSITDHLALSSLATLLGGVAPAAPGAELQDEEKPFSLKNLSPDSHPPLYYGSVKFTLAENSVSRIRVALADSVSAYATVPNYRQSKTGVGFAAVARWPTGFADNKRLRGAAYVIFKAYAWAPEQPYIPGVASRWVLGAFVGADIADKLKTLAWGATADHLFGGDLGVIAGMSYTRQDPSAGSIERAWHTSWVAGISYSP